MSVTPYRSSPSAEVGSEEERFVDRTIMRLEAVGKLKDRALRKDFERAYRTPGRQVHGCRLCLGCLCRLELLPARRPPRRTSLDRRSPDSADFLGRHVRSRSKPILRQRSL